MILPLTHSFRGIICREITRVLGYIVILFIRYTEVIKVER